MDGIGGAGATAVKSLGKADVFYDQGACDENVSLLVRFCPRSR